MAYHLIRIKQYTAEIRKGKELLAVCTRLTSLKWIILGPNHELEYFYALGEQASAKEAFEAFKKYRSGKNKKAPK